MSDADTLKDVKAIEAQSSTILGVLDDELHAHVKIPAKELAKKIRALVEKLEPKDEDA